MEDSQVALNFKTPSGTNQNRFKIAIQCTIIHTDFYRYFVLILKTILPSLLPSL